MEFKVVLKPQEEDVTKEVWDLVVVGLGPAGYTAGIYATRFNIKVLLVGAVQGGLVSETPEVENYPGFRKIKGETLMEKMRSQYLDLGGKILEATVVGLKKNELFEIVTDKNQHIKAKTLILALGTKRRKLNVPGEDKFLGRGVSYCATCDAPFFKQKIVAVIGGGDSAFTATLHLSEFASKVYLIHRREEFRAQPALVKKAQERGIEFIKNKVVKQIEGKLKVEKLILEDTKDNSIEELKVDGVFIEIGYIPTTDLIKELGIEDEHGFIKVKEDMSTNVPGVFAAGDCTNGLNNMKQIITAAAMGAIAAESAYKYLNH